MEYIIQTHNLTKTMNGKNLISNLNLHVKKGEIYGFLGPNGAGKTTTMKLLMNLWRPDHGTIELFGKTAGTDFYEFFRRMAGIIEFPVFYEKLSGRENLELHCEYMGYYSEGAVRNVLELLELEAASEQPVKQYSLGMKQRLGLARAVLTKPELLILDEPANGMDPAGMRQVRELLKMLCRDYGITILLSSHVLAEVEPVAHTIGFIDKGVLRQEISMEEIKKGNLNYIEVHPQDIRKAAYVLAENLQIDNFRIVDNQRLLIYDKEVSVSQLTRSFTDQDVLVDFIGQNTETLEDYFLKMTKNTGKMQDRRKGALS